MKAFCRKINAHLLCDIQVIFLADLISSEIRKGGYPKRISGY